MLKTIPKLFDNTVENHGSNPAFWEKTNSVYHPTSYAEMQEQAKAFAASLKEMGIKKGDRIAILSQARKDWITSELGIFYIGGINVPLSTKLESPDILFRLNHSGSKILLISEIQYPKIEQFINEIPSLERIILFDERQSYQAKEVLFENTIQRGRELLKENTLYISWETENVVGDDDALISYTSGTSADPKGVILTHKNLWVNSLQCSEFFKLEQHFRSLLILPLDHSFAHTALMYTVMRYGASLASVQQGKSAAEALRNLPINIKEINPHLLISVPALTKNFKKNIETGIKKKGKIAELLFKIGIATGCHYHGYGPDKGKGLRALSYIPYRIIDKIIFKKIRENFGTNLKYFVGGGAFLDAELQKFFFAIGIPIYQGYGLTEASPVISANVPENYKIASSGKVINYLDIKICDDNGKTLPLGQKGEIVIRGENVMKGYFLNPTTTAETIIDNWLHTGDMGYLDKDNFLYVQGRFKSLLISNDGEKYSPEAIESTFVERSKYIDQIMLYNNQCNYTTAIIVPKKEAIKNWLHHHHKAERKGAEPFILHLLEKEIAEYKTGGKHQNQFPERWLPTTFCIATEPFTEENKMINSTLKMVRNKITEAYKTNIEYMYTPEGKEITNSKNIESIRQMLA